MTDHKILVTGGTGFLGKAIARKLIATGNRVICLARHPDAELQDLGAGMITADIADSDWVNQLSGIDAIIHTAAKAGVWGSYHSYARPNIVGTENVLKAMRLHGIKYLVHTSTPSVTFTGKDQTGADESEAYAPSFFNFYQSTKAHAEQLVLGAKDLCAVALRPHLIWGPQDNQLVPRILERGRQGKLKLVDHGKKLVDAVYIDNAADAHILALQKLTNSNEIRGKVYYITNQEPWPMKDIINGILAAGGLPPLHQSIPAHLAYLAGAAMEKTYGFLGKDAEPPMTRFVARQLATAHWFAKDRAVNELGYIPKISMSEGMARLKQSL